MMRNHRGLIERSSEGNIEHHIDNCGRRLISVHWDLGATDYAFSTEIKLSATYSCLIAPPKFSASKPRAGEGGF